MSAFTDDIKSYSYYDTSKEDCNNANTFYSFYDNAFAG
jgi:hypothetical protein